MAAIINAPCKGCARRQIGCHSQCPDYIEFQKDNNSRKAKAAKERMRFTPTAGFTKRRGKLIKKGMKCVR